MEQTTPKPEKKKKASPTKNALPIINRFTDGKILFRCYINKNLAKQIADCVASKGAVNCGETLVNLLFKEEQVNGYIAQIKEMDSSVRAVLESYAKEHNICLK